MNNNYNTDEIRVLDWPECIFKRKDVYQDGASGCVREIVDNAIDQSYVCKECDTIFVSDNFNGLCAVFNNGRGIPINLSPDRPGQTQADVSISSMHSSGKFNPRGGTATVGRNGLGSSVTNALSQDYILLSQITDQNYDKSIPAVSDCWGKSIKSKKDLYYIVWYKDGVKYYEGAGKRKELDKLIFGTAPHEEIPGGYATLVIFKINEIHYPGYKVELPTENLKNFLLIQDKFYGKKINLILNGQLITSSGFQPYAFEVQRTIIPKDNSANSKVSVYCTFEIDDQNFGGKQTAGSINSLVVNQGVHINWMTAVFEESLRTEYKIRHKYLSNGLKMFVLMLAEEVAYDSQTKVRLKSVVKVKVSDFVDLVKDFTKIFRKNPEYWGVYVDKLNILANSMKSLSAMDKAQQMIDQNSGNAFYRNKANLVEGFSDATNPNRWDTELFLCEGLSPAGSLKSGRKSIGGMLNHAVLPLRGKVLNVSNVDLDRALENKEISTIFTLLGVGIEGNNVTSGCKTPEEAYAALQKFCRYGKIVIATDADSDGSQIASLLLYLFSKYARFLIEAGMVYIAISPLYMQGKKFFFPTDPIDPVTGFPVGLDLSKGYERYKGLGSIDKDLIYDSYFNPATRKLIQVSPEGIDYSMLLTEDINERKKLLYEAGILTNPYNFNDL